MSGRVFNVRTRDLQRELEAVGFRLDRSRGTHQTWKHPSGTTTVLAVGRKDADPRAVVDVRALVERFEVHNHLGQYKAPAQVPPPPAEERSLVAPTLCAWGPVMGEPCAKYGKALGLCFHHYQRASVRGLLDRFRNYQKERYPMAPDPMPATATPSLFPEAPPEPNAEGRTLVTLREAGERHGPPDKAVANKGYLGKAVHEGRLTMRGTRPNPSIKRAGRPDALVDLAEALAILQARYTTTGRWDRSKRKPKPEAPAPAAKDGLRTLVSLAEAARRYTGPGTPDRNSAYLSTAIKRGKIKAHGTQRNPNGGSPFVMVDLDEALALLQARRPEAAAAKGCKWPGCTTGTKVVGHGYCASHYGKWYRQENERKAARDAGAPGIEWAGPLGDPREGAPVKRARRGGGPAQSLTARIVRFIEEVGPKGITYGVARNKAGAKHTSDQVQKVLSQLTREGRVFKVEHNRGKQKIRYYYGTAEWAGKFTPPLLGRAASKAAMAEPMAPVDVRSNGVGHHFHPVDIDPPARKPRGPTFPKEEVRHFAQTVMVGLLDAQGITITLLADGTFDVIVVPKVPTPKTFTV